MSDTLLHPYPDLVRFLALCTERLQCRDTKARAGIATRIYAQMAPLTEERDKLSTWLDRSLDWLLAHADDPQHDQRADTWFRRLARYEAVCDALDAGRQAVR